MDVGCVAYLEKPFREAQLVEAIKAAGPKPGLE